jgi:hypothetical protein
MKTLDIRENSNVIHDFYLKISELIERNETSEGNIARFFANVLEYYAKQVNLKFVEQHVIPRSG